MKSVMSGSAVYRVEGQGQHNMLKTLSDNKQIMPVCVRLSSLTNFLPTFLFPHFSSKKPHC